MMQRDVSELAKGYAAMESVAAMLAEDRKQQRALDPARRRPNERKARRKTQKKSRRANR
jgi:hypothetical protein